MRLSMEEVQKQHESTKKLYEQGLTVAPVDVKRVIDLYDTIEALQQENEQLQAQVTRAKEVLRKVREALDYWRELYGIGLEVLNWHMNGDIETFDSFYDSSGTYKALAEIDKVIGGKEE